MSDCGRFPPFPDMSVAETEQAPVGTLLIAIIFLLRIGWNMRCFKFTEFLASGGFHADCLL
jgi:hypothetical protein